MPWVLSQVSKVTLNIDIVQGIILYCFNTEREFSKHD